MRSEKQANGYLTGSSAVDWHEDPSQNLNACYMKLSWTYMTLQYACYLHVAMLMYMHVSCNMHGIGKFSMNVPCMLHEYDMHVT